MRECPWCGGKALRVISCHTMRETHKDGSVKFADVIRWIDSECGYQETTTAMERYDYEAECLVSNLPLRVISKKEPRQKKKPDGVGGG